VWTTIGRIQPGVGVSRLRSPAVPKGPAVAAATSGRPAATRTREAVLPPQFITEIDGLDIHFIHVRSQHDDALS
jgi:hypothetical protein